LKKWLHQRKSCVAQMVTLFAPTVMIKSNPAQFAVKPLAKLPDETRLPRG